MPRNPDVPHRFQGNRPARSLDPDSSNCSTPGPATVFRPSGFSLVRVIGYREFSTQGGGVLMIFRSAGRSGILAEDRSTKTASYLPFLPTEVTTQSRPEDDGESAPALEQTTKLCHEMACRIVEHPCGPGSGSTSALRIGALRAPVGIGSPPAGVDGPRGVRGDLRSNLDQSAGVREDGDRGVHRRQAISRVLAHRPDLEQRIDDMKRAVPPGIPPERRPGPHRHPPTGPQQCRRDIQCRPAFQRSGSSGLCS
ncbi:hypothetical protein SAMN04490220_0040 [Rhodococcus jostii]|uniref:Uncharacterized protein n=1 Tax=Rhodococcus jostii TaxID=132919 RepID=A0A1H4IJL8_RHOJO|nr:hypothetical protein SAMN04490220_0040 [Rhodococcus jostii]